MAKKPKRKAEQKAKPPSERDEPIKIDLDPETTLKGLLKVEPGSEEPLERPIRRKHPDSEQ